jgi:beta-lactamase regulating signal transducer with metallopeptidase domain
MKSEILNVCNQLVAAAANGVYQGIIITMLVALCLRWLVRTNAATRHAVWFCTLLLLVGLLVGHGLVDFTSFRRATANDAAPAPKAELRVPSLQTDAVPEVNADDSLGNAANVHGDGPRADQHPLLALIRAQEDSAEGVAEQVNSVESGDAQSDESLLASPVSSETTNLRERIGRLLNPISVELAIGFQFSRITGVLLAVWVMIAVVRVLALIGQLARIRKTKRQSLLPGPELHRLFQTLSDRMITNRRVQLKVSPLHRSSFLLGFRHPVILLPAQERMEPGEAELVLRHELAHVERRDDWANLIQHLVLAIFFFHPAFWWISRQLSLEREIACDDHVLQQSKRPQAYALVLANLAGRMQKQLLLPAPGSSNNKTQLKERIDMILNTHRNASPRLAKTWLALITSMAAVVAVAISFAAPRIVLAGTETTTPGLAAVAPAADMLPVVEATEAAPAISVAGLPHPGSAGNVPPPPIPGLPAGVNVDPKFKAGGHVTLSTSPAVIAGPTISLAPVKTRLSVTAAVPGQPPSLLAAIETPVAPGAPRAPRPAKATGSGNDDSSLEERLDRLERMVNALMNQQNPKGRSDVQLKLENGMVDRKEMARIEGLAKREARKADKKQTVQKVKADSQRQLEDLRRQAENLERQREKLDREIERLEENQDNFDEQDDDSADSDTEPHESKEVCVTESHSHSAQ